MKQNFSCGVCFKSFTNRYALQGHVNRTSHKATITYKSVKDRILQYLQTRSEATFTAALLAATIQCKKTTVAASLWELHNEGKIDRVEVGVYQSLPFKIPKTPKEIPTVAIATTATPVLSRPLQSSIRYVEAALADIDSRLESINESIKFMDELVLEATALKHHRLVLEYCKAKLEETNSVRAELGIVEEKEAVIAAPHYDLEDVVF